MRKFNVSLAVALAVVVAAWLSPAPAKAGLFGRRAAYAYGQAQAPACAGGSCGVQSYATSAPAAYAGQTPLYHPVYTVPTPAQAAPHIDPSWVQAPATMGSTYAQAPARVYASPSSPAEDSPSGFLAALNAYRAARGKHPLAWDSTLASWAAANSRWPHGTMAPGAAQCSARTVSYLDALNQWINSPPHLAILMSATTSVGVSPCAFGMTANAK